MRRSFFIQFQPFQTGVLVLCRSIAIAGLLSGAANAQANNEPYGPPLDQLSKFDDDTLLNYERSGEVLTQEDQQFLKASGIEIPSQWLSSAQMAGLHAAIHDPVNGNDVSARKKWITEYLMAAEIQSKVCIANTKQGVPNPPENHCELTPSSNGSNTHR
ncbi:MAG: hypothetical protein KGJ49_08205 [Alphaproteobacteria bacterium]|nr:hypothetical protein [Alphaproteobacteria bacterium]